MIEALVRLYERRSLPSRIERAGGDEGRACVMSVVERKQADRGAGWIYHAWEDWLRPDRVASRLPPQRFVISQSTPEVGHLRSAGNVVLRLPAVQGFELLPGEVSVRLRGHGPPRLAGNGR